MDYIDTRWFVSYKAYEYGLPPKEDLVITDVTPARWILYRLAGKNEKCIVLYAEEISPALAAELVHTGNIKQNYYKDDG